MQIRRFLVTVLLIVVASCAGIDADEATLSYNCIGCLCEAASQCDRQTACNDAGLCGMFRFSHAYWVDAGQFVVEGDNVSDPQAWVRCSQNVQCAGKTVNSYITRFRKDCNRDGVVNCRDYMLTHHLGGYGCDSGRNPEVVFLRRFEACIAKYPGD